MRNKIITIQSTVGYLTIMVMGLFITNLLFGNINNKLYHQIGLTIVQITCSVYIMYKVKKYFGYRAVGFDKINFKSLIWLIPYAFIIISMIYNFTVNIFQNYTSFTGETWTMIITILIGTIAAGWSEEIMFRGMFLSSFKSDKFIIGAMLISSIGFSILHITTMFMGVSLIEVFIRVIRSSLLGFAFVGMVIKLNNICPLIIFHILWNFIIMVSEIINIEVSKASLFCNPINIIVGIILWICIVIDQKKYKSKYTFSEKLMSEIG